MARTIGAAPRNPTPNKYALPPIEATLEQQCQRGNWPRHKHQKACDQHGRLRDGWQTRGKHLQAESQKHRDLHRSSESVMKANQAALMKEVRVPQ